ncbi:MAG: MATE family efflux transporter [bacterium]|nr:MATE family efflux transporter [bacterium]
MEKNLTTGSVLKTVLYFSLPYLLSYFLQTLYGMADLFIIGQFNGVESTTAVSIGSQVMHMLTVMIVGLAMGATVMIGQAVGANQKEQASHAIGNTILLFMTLSLVLTLLLLLFVRPIVQVMATPIESVSGAIAYLTICFIGIPFITAYNIISSILRGMGDSKSPMYFVALSCLANILLDYLFIGLLGMGAAGAALGTTLSQTLSVLFALCLLLRKKAKIQIPLSFKELRPRKSILLGLLKVGVPVALQDGFIQISFIVITIFANQRGLNDAAAVGIVEKIIGVLFLVPSSMLQSVSALCAQNIGAGRHERARLILYYASAMAILWGAAAVILMQLDAERFIGWFSDNQTVVLLGGQYMRGYVWDCILAGIHFSFSGYFCAYGWSGISFLHNSLSIVCARIPLSYFASRYFTNTLFPMGLASSVGSGVSVLICVGVFLWLNQRQQKQQRQEKQQSLAG